MVSFWPWKVSDYGSLVCLYLTNTPRARITLLRLLRKPCPPCPRRSPKLLRDSTSSARPRVASRPCGRSIRPLHTCSTLSFLRWCWDGRAGVSRSTLLSSADQSCRSSVDPLNSRQADRFSLAESSLSEPPVLGCSITAFLARSTASMSSRNNATRPSRSSRSQPSTTPPNNCWRSMEGNLPNHLQPPRPTPERSRPHHRSSL